MIGQIETYYHKNTPELTKCVNRFLSENDFDHFYSEMLKHSTDFAGFRKRFFTWMDGFRVLKFVHFARDHFYENVELTGAINWLDSTFLKNDLADFSQLEILDRLRKYDRADKADLNQ